MSNVKGSLFDILSDISTFLDIQDVDAGKRCTSISGTYIFFDE